MISPQYFHTFMVPSLTSLAQKLILLNFDFFSNLDKKKKIKNVNLACLCARLEPVFLSKKGPSKARLFRKMSPSEELGTLMSHIAQIMRFCTNCDITQIIVIRF